VAAESAVARRRAESHRPSGGPATDAQPPQRDNRQLPGAVGLLLSLALLSGAGAEPPRFRRGRSINNEYDSKSAQAHLRCRKQARWHPTR
jgi:hypothetical protein